MTDSTNAGFPKTGLATAESAKAPATITLNEDVAGGDASHWHILTSNPTHDVRQWLQVALDDAQMAYGLAQDIAQLPTDSWLIQGPNQNVQVSQIIAVNADQQPQRLIDAYPTVNSPYAVNGKLNRIMCCPTHQQAILNIFLADGTSIYAFDNLYSVNKDLYQHNQVYRIELGGFAYELELVPVGETIVVEDPAAIKHHRALNDILASNNGVVPPDLQDQISNWQEKSDDDKAPVTLDLSKMVAYLYGDNLGQEDEAWFQGEVLGYSQTIFMDKILDLLDVSIIHEQDSNPVVIRLVYLKPESHASFKVGDYIRGNIWLQATIHATHAADPH